MSDLWVFKYAPKKLDYLIATDEKKQILKKIINELPNTLLIGKHGTGKGSFMNILLNSTDSECLKINASDENSIDDVRTKIKGFATSFSGSKKKIVYLNEADGLSPAAQNSMRDLIESTENITRYFLLANYENKITPEIKSRCSYHLDLNDPPGDQIFKKCIGILKNEQVKVNDKKEVIALIKKLYPDIRKIIGTLQANVINGELKTVSVSINEDNYEEIWNKMKEGDPEAIRKILRSNFIDYDEMYNFLYNKVMIDPDLVKKPGDFMIETGEYLYRNATVAIKEINFMAYFFNLLRGGTL